MDTCLRIEHFNGVVAKRSHVEPLRGRVEGKVIDATFHVRELDGASQRQRLLRGPRLNSHCANDQCEDATAHIDLILIAAVGSARRPRPRQGSSWRRTAAA